MSALAEPAPIVPAAPRNSLGHRLVVAMLLVSLAVSVLVSLAQLLHAYRQERAAAERRLDEIGASLVPSLAASLWVVDEERIDLLLDGVARLPDVAHLVLVTPEGERWERGDALADPLLERRYSLQHGGALGVPLGQLQVTMGRAELLARLGRQGFAIALTTTIALVCAALLLFMMFRHTVTRHLYAMASYASALTLQRLRTPLVLDGKARSVPPDELDQVVDSFNLMRETLLEDLALRERYEAELLQHRERLEELVAARTAELAAQAEQLRAQREQMQRLANTDALTGCASRRHFAELAEAESARSRRSGEPLGLLLVDVDHFKQINDRFGHATGDLVLVALCDALRTELRPFDVLGRLGGEEFAALLPGCPMANLMSAAERLRQTVAQLRPMGPQGESIAFTVSIGTAVLHERDGGLDALLRRADAALYRAKRGGRDRVCAAEEAD